MATSPESTNVILNTLPNVLEKAGKMRSQLIAVANNMQDLGLSPTNVQRLRRLVRDYDEALDEFLGV